MENTSTAETVQLILPFVYVLFGFIFGQLPAWFNRKRKLKTHWRAIRADLERCKEKAETLLNDKISAPLYRLPVVAFNTSFPILLSEGELTEEESLTIGRCFDQIQDINRGLDYASELHKQVGQASKRDQEYNRNVQKARDLLGEKGKPNLYDAAKKIVDGKIARHWGRY